MIDINLKYIERDKIRILLLIALLSGFTLAFIGVILMFHFDVWTGLMVTLVGMYGAIRAVHRSDNATSN